jgi:glycosyltransferase involved in cell wall biosynthesis
MSISACYITKNADEFLDTSIKSIKPFVDEIFIADDMSEDKTLEIVKQNDCKIIQKDYSKLYPLDSSIKGIGANKAKVAQRNDSIRDAKGDYILIMDDDEVYHEDTMRVFVDCARLGRNEQLRFPFYHFWKCLNKRIVGHMWNNRPERFYKRKEGLSYVGRSDTVCIPDGRLDCKVNGSVGRDDLKCFHYSYLKDPEKIICKLRKYLLRDNPNVNESNLEEWLMKLPFMGGVLNQPRYGNNGLYIAGCADNQKEEIFDFSLENHPKIVFRNPIIYRDYKKGADKYMETHWQFHNHLTYPRHQARIKYTSRFCFGKTLECGSANGYSTHVLNTYAKEVHNNAIFSGYEITDWGYAEAIKTYPQYNFYKGFGEIMPFKDGEFDTVLMPEVIEHCLYPRALADEGWRVAKQRLIITTPTKNHPDPDHKRFFPMEEMRKFLRPYGEPMFYGLDINGNICERDFYFLIAVVDKE